MSFVHVASVDTEDGSNPLDQTPRLRRVRGRRSADRCVVGPVALGAELVGSYGFAPAFGGDRA